MTYVSADVARQIEQSVEIVRNGPECARAAALDYIRENAPQDKVEGAEYMYVHKDNETEFCPKTGTIGIMTNAGGEFRFPAGSLPSGDREVWKPMDWMRRISRLTATEQTHPEAARPEAGKAVRMYCVRDYKPGEWLTKGKIYTPDKDLRITFDDGYVGDNGWMFFNFNEFHLRDVLFPLVQRPARVGEWVYSAVDYGGFIRKGGIYLVRTAPYEEDGALVVDAVGGDCRHTCIVRERNYFVLDGYQPAEAKPAEAKQPAAKPVESKIIITSDGTETLARLYEDGKVVKEAKAKRNPSDTYSFATGADIAYRRLVGEKPAGFDWDGFKAGKFSVRVRSDSDAKAFLKECAARGFRWLSGHRADEWFCESSYIGCCRNGLFRGKGECPDAIGHPFGANPAAPDAARIARLEAELKATTADRDSWQRDFNRLNEGGLERIARLEKENAGLRDKLAAVQKRSESLLSGVERIRDICGKE